MPTTEPRAPKPSLLAKIFSILSSFGLATVVLIFLLIITLLGTLEQVDHGLFDSTKKYFESNLVTNIDIGSWKMPILLPGGTLLMEILFINMLCGAVIRIRKTKRNIGTIIAHVAILFMLFAGFVSQHFKKDGNLALLEGQSSDEFQSYHDSVIEIERISPTSKDGKRSALVIDAGLFNDLGEGKARTFTNKDLPFDLQVTNYEANAEPRRTTDAARKWQADGYYIQPLPKKAEAEMNLDAAYIKIIDKKTKEEQTGIVWRASAAPFSVKVGEEVYSVELTRRKWKLPFVVKLDKFEREVHPGTERARKFTSHVVKTNPGGHDEKKIITMNAPLRDSGLVLFQASFSQEQGGGGAALTRSVFAVVSNPADQWPLYSLIAVGVGLLIRMVMQLAHYLGRMKRKNAPQLATSSIQ